MSLSLSVGTGGDEVSEGRLCMRSVYVGRMAYRQQFTYFDLSSLFLILSPDLASLLKE